MPSAIDCYICHDSDGTYCLPKSYTTNGRFSGLINGKATERLTKQIILEQYQGGDVFHAGAFIGDFFPALSRTVGGNGKIISCEPVPLSYRAASHTIALSGLTNVVLTKCALAADDGQLEIAVEDEHGNNYAQTARVGAAGKSITVPTTSIDKLCKDFDISILHLDLEGAEIWAMEGALATLANPKCQLVIIENFQTDVAHRFLKGWTCCGEADNNYFFTRSDLSGQFIDEARGNLRRRFEKIIASLQSSETFEPSQSNSLTAEEWKVFETEVLQPAYRRAEEGVLPSTPEIESVLGLMKFARLGYHLEDTLNTLKVHFSENAHPTLAYAYASLALECDGDAQKLLDICSGISDRYPNHAEIALLTSKLYQQVGNNKAAIEAMSRALAARPGSESFKNRYDKLVSDFG